jgi:hypothetical protein
MTTMGKMSEGSTACILNRESHSGNVESKSHTHRCRVVLRPTNKLPRNNSMLPVFKYDEISLSLIY